MLKKLGKRIAANKAKKKKLNLTWHQVFDTSKNSYGHLDLAFDVVKLTGYQYFTWNGYIYVVIGDNAFVTSTKVEDVA